MGKMVSMKITPAEEKLRPMLGNEALDRLGIDLKEMNVGQKIEFHAQATVTAITRYESMGPDAGGDDRTLKLQIIALSVDR